MHDVFHWLVNSIFVFAVWYVVALIIHTFLRLSASAKYGLILLIQIIACFHWIATYFFPLKISGTNAVNLTTEWLVPYSLGAYTLIVAILIFFDAFHIRYIKKTIYSYHHYPSKLSFAIQKIQSYAPLFPVNNIRFSTKAFQPFVIGLLKPMIVLPIALINQLPTTTIEWILLHEWIHIKHYDLYLHHLGKVMCRILFFNPFFKSLNSLREQLMEERCDEWVLHYKNEPFEYSSALLELAKLQANYPYPSFSSKDTLLKRIQRINGAKCTIDRFNWKMLLVSTLAILFALVIEPKMTLPSLTANTNLPKREKNSNPTSIKYTTAKISTSPSKPVIKNKNIEVALRNEFEEPIIGEVVIAENDLKESNLIQAIAVKDTSLGWIAQPLLKREPIEMETWIPIDYEKITIKRKKKDGNWETWEILIPKSAAKQKIQIELPEE